MRKLMLTTAIVAATSVGAIAQTATQTDSVTAAPPAAMTVASVVPAFRASDLTGSTLYTLDTEETRALSTLRDDASVAARDRVALNWESGATFAANRDAWESVGAISDIILTQDGAVRGVLIDVGGFLGLGARSVMIDIDDLYFVADDETVEDINDFMVVAAMTREEFQALPEYDDTILAAGFQPREVPSDSPMQDEGAASDPVTAPVPDMASTDTAADTAADMTAEVGPGNYQVLPPDERTADRLMGADVYDIDGENIATVSDLVMADTGEVTHAVIDVGGVLGIGTYTVALELDTLDILWSDENDDVRVELPMTREQLGSLPEYQG